MRERVRKRDQRWCQNSASGRMSLKKEHRIWRPKSSDEVGVGVWPRYLPAVGSCPMDLQGLNRKSGWECIEQMLKLNTDVRALGNACYDRGLHQIQLGSEAQNPAGTRPWVWCQRSQYLCLHLPLYLHLYLYLYLYKVAFNDCTMWTRHRAKHSTIISFNGSHDLPEKYMLLWPHLIDNHHGKNMLAKSPGCFCQTIRTLFLLSSDGWHLCFMPSSLPFQLHADYVWSFY